MSLARYTREISVGVAYLALMGVLAVAAPSFFQSQLFATWVSSSAVLVATVGMTLVILARHIDISIGSQFSVCGVVAGLAASAGCPMPVVAAIAMGTGAAMGAINGVFVAIVGLPSIVVTLATMVILREGLRWAREGEAVRNLPEDFQWFGYTQQAGQWIIVVTALLVFVAFAWGMRYLGAGRAVYAVGSDAEAARLAGIRPRRVVFAVFVLMGLLTGLASLLNAVRFMNVDANAGAGLELTVIAAVVVGGTAVSGGRGTLVGTLFGVLLLGTIGAALFFLHAESQWEKAIQGLIILIAVAFDGFSVRRRGAEMGRFAATFRSPQLALAALVLVEIAVFAVIGKNFLTWANFAELTRQSVELGLLSLALSLVIATGGIDLSVGSLLGLSAVVFGKLWRDGFWSDGGFSPAAAAVATLALGALAGCLNGALITRLSIPPLIVTLGTYSLFRGLAEGMTGGVDNFTNFPESFLYFGHEAVAGLPVQLWVLIAAAILAWILLHRSVVGRELTAIGYSSEAARHAAIPVERRLMLVYTLAGIAAALAALIYVARVGQAKADAGIGFELSAITAVVLGGTSIFGGRATVGGTLLGLFAIAILQNGLRLADMAPELAGVLTGCLLLVAIGFDSRQRIAAWLRGSKVHAAGAHEGITMRNSQLAALCGVILLGAGIVAAANFWLVRSIQRELNERSSTGPVRSAATNGSKGKPVTVAMMPKSKGNAYFIACRKGAEEAARELGVELLWDGPTDPDPAKQNEIVETWITRGVDVIAVAVENREGLSTALRKAREKGIKVITWDADAAHGARDFFVNQATPEGIANTLMDKAAELMGGDGEFAIITATLTAANQNEWLKHIEARREAKYPNIEKAIVRPCDDLQAKAFEQANVVLNAHPNVELIMAICSPAVPGAAEAVKQSGRNDVKVIGLGLPNDNKPYVHQGVTQAVILWNTMDLGYLTVHASRAVAEGALKPGDTAFSGGRLGKLKLEGDSIVLGQPFVFTKENIDQFDF